jgi:hypothetical protein
MAGRGFGRGGLHGAPGGMILLADADKDGTVTRAEAKAARDSMRQRWQVRREAQRAG